ncbi:TIGR02452 family protein [Actinoplanes ianthinogenes]|uniref:TIGR02452 family protein n=1 Tax=Actinoplanes ianthinogenes TaxID=122358 RepID=A0ABM7LMR2_9ACTN|nr:TIGR02452 family protein [Actinoplanes ianthinogenes]GGR49966.1 TIGR02452 family protein [Actinoplanes ianthinogenes]
MRALGQEAARIAEEGHYTGPDGRVEIADQVARAVAGTRLHLPGDTLPEPTPAAGPPVIEVTAESTLWAARRLGTDPACLNFASARNPGGGFLNGAQAQEESLARSSALYPCLLAAGDFYAHHRAERSLLYTDRIIYAPSVPVFRDDKGRLLPTAYPVSFLVSAAPNRSAIARNQPESLPEISTTLARRAARVLAVAAAHGHRELVLGAWGCGVFGNDPAEVARIFAEALTVSPWFDRVVFAILDRGGATRQAFERVFRT